MNMMSLSGHPKNVIFVKQRLYGKPRWKGGTLSTGGLQRGKVLKMFLKMTHNLVFAGQPYRTTTLPQHGHGAKQETCSC